MKIAAVLPAYNEETRVRNVVSAVLRAPSIDEVIVVNDGSNDRTADVVRSIPGIDLIDLPLNTGKGGAMTAGAEATDADIIVFLDADLIGLKPEHVEALIAPVRCGRAKMAVGSFRGGRKLTDWAQRITPNITGQRAIRRDIWEQIPNLDHARYGVEMAITRFCHYYRVTTAIVPIPGVTHPMKEEKLGYVRGLISRAYMYKEIFKILIDLRAPRRIRPRRRSLIRTIAATRRRMGKPTRATDWLYRRELNWRRRRREERSSRKR